MSKVLDPDALGEVGELFFAGLCTQSGLVANKVSRDRGGWDFRVEYPIAEYSDVALDQREPRNCYVQVKCSAGDSGYVRARLTAVERLAKERGPAAIIAFKMRPNGTALMGYAIHLLGKDLAKILRRLRKAESDGQKDINNVWIYFDYRKGRRFAPDAEGLAAALAEICPEDTDAYIGEKQHQLATLGYEGQGLEGEALILIDDKDHFIKIISGLAPLKPLELKLYDRRFDMRIPYEGDLFADVEEFALDLPRIGLCNIIIRGGPLLPAAIFRCETLVPVPIAGGPILTLRHPMLNVVIQDGSFEIETIGNFLVAQHDLANWNLLVRGLTYLAGGKATVEIEFRGNRIAGIPAARLSGPYLEQLPTLLSFVERLQRAIEIAGVDSPEPFTIEEIVDATTMQMSLDMLFNPNSAARFEFGSLAGVTDEERLDALFFNTVEFAKTRFSFAVKVTLERSPEQTDQFASTGFELVDLRPAVADMQEYGA